MASEHPQAISAVVLRGDFNSFCLPQLLYHGTCSAVASVILRNGFGPHCGVRESLLSDGSTYLTTNLGMATSFAASRATKRGGSPAVIAVDAANLDPDSLSFDLNMSGGRHWTEALKYNRPIDPGAFHPVDIGGVDLTSVRMLLNEPVPGERALAFELQWSRATEMMGHLQMDEVARFSVQRPVLVG